MRHHNEASKKWLSSWIKSSPSTTLIVSHEKVRRCRLTLSFTVKAPGINPLTLKYDQPLPTFAFKFNLRRCKKELLDGACSHIAEVRGKGLHWYVGNYTKFLGARDERIRVARAGGSLSLIHSSQQALDRRLISSSSSSSSSSSARAWSI